MDNLALEDWQPMPPEMGPPLPRSIGIYWPWYKVAVPPLEVVPPAVPVVAPPVVPVIVAPPAAPPVIAYPPYPPVAYPPVEAPPVIVYPPAPPPEVPAPPATYYLYVATVGEGVVTPGAGDYSAHLPVTLTATPSPGFDFDYWGGDVSGTIPVVSLLMNSDKAVTAYFKPIEVPAPPPKLPTVNILSAAFTPSEATVGDVVSGTISWMPTIPGSPELFDFGISADLIDSAGRRVMNVFTAYPTGEIGTPQATPFSLDTRGLPEGWYGLQVHFSDLTGVEIAKRSFLNLLHLLPLPEIPAPPPPPPAVEISIAAPESAEAGEKVPVYVKVTNLMGDRYHLGTELSVNAVPILSTSEFFSGGQSKTYGMSFYMPRIPASLVAVVKYPVDGVWVPVGSASKTVTLAPPEVPVPEIPAPPPPPEVPAPPPPPEVAAPPLTEAELEAFRELALKVNIDLGGSYVAGVLTPPAGWVGSVTEWSRHVQAETLKRWLLGERV